MTVCMQKQKDGASGCGCSGVQLPGTSGCRRQQANGLDACSHRFNQRRRSIGAASVDDDDVIKAALKGELESALDHAGFVERGNDDREGRAGARSGRRWRRVNAYPGFFGSLNIKYMTMITVAQNTTCLCQNKTSP